MKHEIIQQEILLFTGTSFTRRQFCSTDAKNDTGKKLSPAEELEKACWAGMLCELLPELAGSPSARPESFIWNVLNGKKFLYISIGPCPVSADSKTSIDPYLFITVTNEN